LVYTSAVKAGPAGIYGRTSRRAEGAAGEPSVRRDMPPPIPGDYGRELAGSHGHPEAPSHPHHYGTGGRARRGDLNYWCSRFPGTAWGMPPG